MGIVIVILAPNLETHISVVLYGTLSDHSCSSVRSGYIDVHSVSCKVSYIVFTAVVKKVAISFKTKSWNLNLANSSEFFPISRDAHDRIKWEMTREQREA